MNHTANYQLMVATKNQQLGAFIAQHLNQKSIVTLDLSGQLPKIKAIVAQHAPKYLLISSCFDGSLDGLEICRQIRAISQLNTKCLVMFSQDFKGISEAFLTDISAYLYDDVTPDEIAIALETLDTGRRYINPNIFRDVTQYMQMADYQNIKHKLAQREQEILDCLGEGHKIPKIADLLCISHRTVESHCEKMVEKLGLDTVTALKILAIRVTAYKAPSVNLPT